MADLLPVETWRQIMRFASHDVERSFDSEMTAQFDLRRSRSQFLQIFDWRKPQPGPRSAKYNLMLVCRLWSVIASEIMYEDIILKNSQSMSTLANALELSKRGGRGHAMGYGWWIRSLEIEDPPPDLALLGTLLQYCPALVRLRVGSRWEPVKVNFDERDIFSLLQPFHVSLGRVAVELGFPSQSFDFVRSSSCYAPFTNLDTLTLHYGKSPNNEEVVHLSSPSRVVITMPRLTTLILKVYHCGTAFLSTWHFPSLKNLIMDSAWNSDVDAIKEMILRSGNLRSLEIWEGSYQLKANGMLSIIHAAPNLHELVVYPHDCPDFNPVTRPPHMGVSDVGLAFRSPEWSSQDPEHDHHAVLDRQLSGVLLHFPRVKRIRFMDESHPGDLVKQGAPEGMQTWWIDWVRRVEKAGIRLENVDGALITLS